MIFSSGIPILYLISFMFMAVFFWVYKFLLLFAYEKSYSFSPGLPVISYQFFVMGLILHIVFASIFYSSTKSLGEDLYIESNRFANVQKSLLPGFSERLKSYHSVIFTDFFLIILLIFLGQKIIRNVMRIYNFFVASHDKV